MLPVIWLALHVAPVADKGLVGIIAHLSTALKNPLLFEKSKNTLRCVLAFLCAYILCVFIFISTLKNYRHGVEHGSAKWGNSKSLNKKYRDKKRFQNKILTKNISVGLDGRKHRRNLNTLVIGGSGAGKTRFYCKPNLMQANTSYIVLDPKGEQLRDTGHLLEKQGYKIKVLDLIHMEKSDCYNPFEYIRDDNDVQRLVTNLFKATSPKGSQSGDSFWDTSASMLLLALMFYLVYEAPKHEQNFDTVLFMLRAGEIREDDEEYVSSLDELFDRLKTREPNHIATNYYDMYKKGAGKTIKSIQITLAARLEKFNLKSLVNLTSVDELELDKIGEEKTVLFAVIPDNDSSFNFIISMLYIQLFQVLFGKADFEYGGRLPVHVHFLMDEFANVSLPNDFDKVLSTMRSREVSASIILQNLAQLKALFDKEWESIVGNCDSFLYLGGNEQGTHKYVSELLGKETIDTNTFGKSTGRSGSFSTNYQNAGRDLLTPDEVRTLSNKYAILFIRGERPVMDLKFDIMRHKNIRCTVDGGAESYSYGEVKGNCTTVNVLFTNDPEVRLLDEFIIPKEYENLEIEFFSDLDFEDMEE